jgi:hypothetical protein
LEVLVLNKEFKKPLSSFFSGLAAVVSGFEVLPVFAIACPLTSRAGIEIFFSTYLPVPGSK